MLFRSASIGQRNGLGYHVHLIVVINYFDFTFVVTHKSSNYFLSGGSGALLFSDLEQALRANVLTR